MAGVGDISTDLLSPGGDAHSRSDRELHGKCMFDHNKEQQKELLALQKKHPDKRIMLVAEKGTMGVGSSRMSGVNNVALWIGKQASPYIPFIKVLQYLILYLWVLLKSSKNSFINNHNSSIINILYNII